MHATIEAVDAPPEAQHTVVDLRRLVDAVAGQPGCVRGYGLQSTGSTARHVIALWHRHDDARRRVERTRREIGPRAGARSAGQIYEVHDDLPGVAVDATPTAACMTFFGGLTSQPTIVVGRCARMRRIAPVVLAIPGYVRLIGLFHPATGDSVELGLLTCAAVADAARIAAVSVPLAAEQRWVREPDRVELYTVAALAAGSNHAVPPDPADQAWDDRLLRCLH